MKKISFILLSFLFLFTACRKYQDGPAFTLLSKKKRLERDWILNTAVEENGTSLTDVTDFYPEMRLRLREDTIIVLFSPVTEKLYGTWELAEGKEALTWAVDHNPVTEINDEGFRDFSFEDMSYDSLERFDIRRLATDELWLTDKFNNVLRFVEE